MKSTQKSGGNQQTVRGVVVVYYRRLLFHSFFSSFSLSFNIERTGINGQTEKKPLLPFTPHYFLLAVLTIDPMITPGGAAGIFIPFFFIPSYAK